MAFGSRAAKEQQAIAPAPRRRRQEQRSCLAKQQEKKQRREEEAFQDGCLLDSEVTDELRARVVARQKKDAANDRQRQTATLRRNLKVAMLSRPVPWSKLGGLMGGGGRGWRTTYRRRMSCAATSPNKASPPCRRQTGQALSCLSCGIWTRSASGGSCGARFCPAVGC